jgi:hypothetical protein
MAVRERSRLGLSARFCHSRRGGGDSIEGGCQHGHWRWHDKPEALIPMNLRLRLSPRCRNGAVASAVLVHHTRGIGPLRLALAGATRSDSAGVGSLGRDPIMRLCRNEPESIGINT